MYLTSVEAGRSRKTTQPAKATRVSAPWAMFLPYLLTFHVCTRATQK